MKDITALTNALTDISVHVSEKELAYFGMKKGVYNRKSQINFSAFMNFIEKKEKFYSPAGSPANVVFNASVLGLDCCLMGNIGEDILGARYIGKLNNYGIESKINAENGASGVCYVMITPDGERTSTAILGVAGNFEFNFKKLKKSRIFHTSGYELSVNPEKTTEIIKYFKKKGTEISFDLAEASMIKKQIAIFENILPFVDILFMTEEESEMLTCYAPEKALEEMSKICKIAVLKKASRGSVIRKGNEEHTIPIIPVRVVSACGAGDSYSSGFLFAHLKKMPFVECGYMGSYIASRICSSENPHF